MGVVRIHKSFDHEKCYQVTKEVNKERTLKNVALRHSSVDI